MQEFMNQCSEDFLNCCLYNESSSVSNLKNQIFLPILQYVSSIHISKSKVNSHDLFKFIRIKILCFRYQNLSLHSNRNRILHSFSFLNEFSFYFFLIFKTTSLILKFKNIFLLLLTNICSNLSTSLFLEHNAHDYIKNSLFQISNFIIQSELDLILN